MEYRCLLLVALGAAALTLPSPTAAQFGGIAGNKQVTPLDRGQPVAFTADHFEYDRNTGIVTATGHVEAWQNDHVLRADKVTFDRNTNVAAAEGHVVILEPDGQVLFSDYAELTQGMREAVLKGMRSLLAENGKLVANGARRTDGQVNELTHAVYTTCNLCKTDPSRPPLWQLQAYAARQDLVNKRIEYEDATLDFYGIPVGWLPFFSHPDPSVRRASGFLVPSFGDSSHIGAFLETPYYWVIDDQRDMTITPELTSNSGEQLELEYRQRFNNGRLTATGAIAETQGQAQGYIFAKGTFDYDDTWRYGFNLNRASSATYLTDFKVQNYSSVLTSSAFIEGFGAGSYTKLDAIAYQGLATTISQANLPFVLPRYEYSFFSEPIFGGRFRVDTTDFNVIRQTGTSTQRAALSLDYQKPLSGYLGEQYNTTVHLDTAAYSASDLTQQPNYSTAGSTEIVRTQPTVAETVRWPFMRDGGTTGPFAGTQVIEPIVQLVASPNAGAFFKHNIPNEDSLDFEFSDANLFSLNKFPGIDRFEGGLRANVGLHTNWTLAGMSIDSLIGQSYRTEAGNEFPALSGLNKSVSDVVARTTITPASWFDLTARTRVDPQKGDIRFVDTVASAGVPLLKVSAGYFYSATNPYYLYTTEPSANPNGLSYPTSYFVPRNEITVGLSTQVGPYKLTGYVRDNLKAYNTNAANATTIVTGNKLDAIGMHGTYEDECFIFDVNFYRRYTSINNDNGGTTILFQITLKSVGQFGFHG